MILLWGVPGDAPLDAVYAALQRRDVETQLLDQRAGAAMQVELQVGRGGRLAGTIQNGAAAIDLAEVGAAYIRPMDTAKACGTAAPTDPTFVAALAADTSMITWSNLADAHVVNRPQAMASNNSKPYQLAQIAGFGFAVPDTLVTTDAAAVRTFCERHERVIFKSVSGVRSIVAQLAPQDSGLEDVANCPTQFQQYVPGEDVRVHVVGERILATRIVSDASDYRYASRSGDDLAMAAVDLPPALAENCYAMTRGMDLQVSGIDLRHAPTGEWYCFEVNPSPGFTFFEAITGQPIAAAIADLLIHLADG